MLLAIELLGCRTKRLSIVVKQAGILLHQGERSIILNPSSELIGVQYFDGFWGFVFCYSLEGSSQPYLDIVFNLELGDDLLKLIVEF